MARHANFAGKKYGCRHRTGGDEDAFYPHGGACGPYGVEFLAKMAVEGWSKTVFNTV